MCLDEIGRANEANGYKHSLGLEDVTSCKMSPRVEQAILQTRTSYHAFGFAIKEHKPCENSFCDERSFYH
jgi:hypothetical protein